MCDKNNGNETNNSADTLIKLVESPKKPEETLVPWPGYAEFFQTKVQVMCDSENSKW